MAKNTHTNCNNKHTSFAPILIKIAMTLAVAFIAPFRCFKRINPAKDVLGNYEDDFTFSSLTEAATRKRVK